MRAKTFVKTAITGLSLVPVAIGSAFAGSDPKGIWLDDTGRGAVEIKSCDSSGNALCGNVVWVKSAGDAEGCGKQILGNVKPVAQGRWDNGWIYSPEKGRKYDVELVPLSNGKLKVVGYAGLKFLSKTMIWTPAPQDLQLCGSASSNPGTTPAAVTPTSAPSDSATTHERDAAAKPAAESKSTPEAKPAPEAKSEPEAKPAQEAKGDATPAKHDQSQATAKDEEPAADEKTEDDAGVDLGKLKIGDLQLDKFVSRTKDGRCKLNLPWVKVTIDCER